MIKKSHFIFLVVLAGLVSCSPGAPSPTAVDNSTQVAFLPEANWPQEVQLDTPPNTPVIEAMDTRRWTLPSPDGEWIAEGVIMFPKDNVGGQKYFTGLILRSADGKRQWTIIDEWAEIGVGLHTPEPVRWSKDGRSFYYTFRVLPDGCQLFWNSSGLLKVNADSGVVTEILPYPTSNWIALSPDETTVAFFGRGGLVLRDLSSGQERVVAITHDKEDWRAGHIIWSPDSKAIALTLVTGACWRIEESESTSILVVDIATLAVKAVLDNKKYLVTEEWADANHVMLKDPQENKWLWEVETGELTQQ